MLRKVALEILEKSFLEVMQTLNTSLHPHPTPLTQGYLASIKLNDATIYILASTPLLTLLAQNLLFEDNPDAATLQDMTKELANLIVGKAKVLSQESGQTASISTPLFCGQISQDIAQDAAQNIAQDSVASELASEFQALPALHFGLDNNPACSIFMKG